MTQMTVKLAMAGSAVLAGVAGCAFSGKTQNEGRAMVYEVHRPSGPMVVDGNWEKDVWQSVEPIRLTHFMGHRPEHFPLTQAKLLYDDQFLYVIFRVEDRYVRAVACNHQDPVCRDSCVEFFFVPGTDLKAGYFNLEMNCGGTMLFHFQVVPRKDSVAVSESDLKRIGVAHVLPKIVDPEISEPTVWTVEYRLPLDILTRDCPGAVMPAPGVTWRANFYKCADATSHPHWLTWSYVDRPSPDFHVPESFGTLEFK